MKPITVLSLFDGISCGRVALERAGIPVKTYYASEIDKYAIQVTQKNYPNTIQLGDVTKIDFKQFEGKVDLLIGGSPCQDLSIAGNRKGLAGERSGLFYKYVEALQTIKPKYFLLENNVGMPKEAYEEISQLLGCYPVMINAALVSAQSRKRFYWTNIGEKEYDLFQFPTCAIPQPNDKKIYLQSILTSGFADRLKARCLTESDSRPEVSKESMLKRYFGAGFRTLVFEDLNDKYSCRWLNQTELERCQTLPEGYTKILNRNKAAGVIGDGWTVDVIAHIFNFLKEELEKGI